MFIEIIVSMIARLWAGFDLRPRHTIHCTRYLALGTTASQQRKGKAQKAKHGHMVAQYTPQTHVHTNAASGFHLGYTAPLGDPLLTNVPHAPFHP